MQARLVPTKEGQEERMRAMGITDPKRIYTERDLAPGPDILFVAAGVTDGTLLRGVRLFGNGIRTSAVLMALREHMIRFVDTVRLVGDAEDAVVEF
jgi:fructose-1,6-bisphosphatase/sedoheptulose 1,7-bisphosphatase-like protein